MLSPKNVRQITSANQFAEYMTRPFSYADKKYRAIKSVAAKALEADKVYASVSRDGTILVKFLGVTDYTEQYSETPAFSSLRDLMQKYDVNSASALEAFQDETKIAYGYHFYILLEALPRAEQIAFTYGLYLHNGRWCEGSSADAVSFVLLEEVQE